jgi:hypothetical protein
MILECYKILKQIELHPAMWTGEATLDSIRNYISGYYHALLDNKIVHKAHTDEPFFDWVANKLGYYESSAGWANMILAYCMGFKPQEINWEDVFATPVTKEQHLKSISYFYELLEEFKKEHEIGER